MGTTTITLTSIYCGGTSESGHDEVAVLFQSDAGFPGRVPTSITDHHSMAKGDTWDINLQMEFTNDVLVSLYDQDESLDPRLADYLVSYDYTPDSVPSSVSLTNHNGAKYTLYATINSIAK